MAIFTPNMPDEFIAQLESLGDDYGRIVTAMLEAGADVLYKDLQGKLQQHQESGDLRRSIRIGKVKKKGEVYRVSITPRGNSKDGNGKKTPNSSVLMKLEYGTRRQKANPVVRPSVADSEEKVIEAMRDIFEYEMQLKNLKHT